MGVVMQVAPNHIIKHFTTSTNGWRIIANDGTEYTTLALLKAALKGPFPYDADPRNATYPGIPIGTPIQYIMLRSENGSGADGSPFYVAFDYATAPTDNDAHLVSGSGQTITFPGGFNNIWLRKTTAGDEIILTVGF